MHRLALGLGVVTLLVAGCGGGGDTGQAATGSSAPTVTAAASVYPLAWLAGEIAPNADIEFLGARSTEAHDLELTPGQRAAVGSADVVLYLGELDYQPQVESAVASATGEVVDASQVAGPERMRTASQAHAHAHEEPAEGALDAHVWFDASIMADVAERTGEAFAAADPDRADDYRANAERVAEQLRVTADEVDQLLAGKCRFDEVVVSHAAYGYLLEPHGHGQHALVGVRSGEAGASAAELAEITAEIRAEGFSHVLAEPVEGRSDAEAVVRETGVELLEVFPLDVVTDGQAEQGYPALLREQAQTFATALGCG